MAGKSITAATMKVAKSAPADNVENVTDSQTPSKYHIIPGKNGGFSVEHHYEHSGAMDMSPKEMEVHHFGPKDGAKLVKHLKKHLGLAHSDATGAAENTEEAGA